MIVGFFNLRYSIEKNSRVTRFRCVDVPKFSAGGPERVGKIRDGSLIQKIFLPSIEPEVLARQWSVQWITEPPGTLIDNRPPATATVATAPSSADCHAFACGNWYSPTKMMKWINT